MASDNEQKSLREIRNIGIAFGGAIVVGFIVVAAYPIPKDSSVFLPLVWSLALMMIGVGLGFLFGIPKLLTENVVTNRGNEETRPNASGGYRPNTHLEKVSEWLTTLIVGITLVQWEFVVANFASTARHIASGISADKPELFTPLASALILYFSITGFLGAYLLTRTYLTNVFEKYDRGGLLDDVLRRELNNSDLTNPDRLLLSPAAMSVATKIVSTSLDDLQSLDDVIAWSKAQLASSRFDAAVEGYRRATLSAPNDISLQLEFANALYHAGAQTSDDLVREQFRIESERALRSAYSLLDNAPGPELRMKVYRALTFFYLFSPLDRKDFENTIRYGEEYDRDANPRKILSVGLLVNLASAYGQRFKWLVSQNNKNGQMEARDAAFSYCQRVIDADTDGRWRKRLETLIRTDIPKTDASDDDLEVFEQDPDFRQLLGLS